MSIIFSQTEPSPMAEPNGRNPAGSAPPSGDGCPVWRSPQASPDKNAIFPLMHSPKFTAIVFGGLGLCLVLETRPAKTASNWVRVSRVERLPKASFRFSSRQTPFLLANGKRSPAPVQDFHHRDDAHAGRTRKAGPRTRACFAFGRKIRTTSPLWRR